MQIKNNNSINYTDIPRISYPELCEKLSTLADKCETHCVNYFAIQNSEISENLTLIALVADDLNHTLQPYFVALENNEILESITPTVPALHCFEREISERYAIQFNSSVWNKPFRYDSQAIEAKNIIEYPFYEIDSDSLHQVGVGPIHAGIIEPGHFRFICDGEEVLNLEIQLGYQHRGVEQLFLDKKKLNQRACLAENIGGDCAAAHSVAFAQCFESLADIRVSPELETERTIALELERIAVHLSDLSGMSTDVAYQLGSSVYGALRTPIINFFQAWCGNRLAKGLVRPGGTWHPLDRKLADKLKAILIEVKEQFNSISELTFHMPSVMERFVAIGQLSAETIADIGAVGMVARIGNLSRDVRTSHPHGSYSKIEIQSHLLSTGDVFARGWLRVLEVRSSIEYILQLLDSQPYGSDEKPALKLQLQPSHFSTSLVEGWRGEINHSAITDKEGNLIRYKIKDPSVHNWLALALALRNQEISDFPINNKSFDLSYSGHDL